MEELTIECTDEFLSSLGTGSLIGIVLSKNKRQLPKKLILQFPQSSLDFCKKNKGPRDLILTEYNVPCLLESVIWFMNSGTLVEITYKQE